MTAIPALFLNISKLLKQKQRNRFALQLMKILKMP